VPFVMTALYVFSVYLRDGGLGWPPNMIVGAPFIAGFVGLLVAFCYSIPLAMPAVQPDMRVPEMPVPDVTLHV